MGELRRPRPLAKADDRTGFDCGRESLNHWFRRYSWINHERGISRTNVLCDRSGAIVAYVSMSAAQIERSHLAKASQRNAPAAIPVILLGQLAVDRSHQGKGYARSLLLFALRTAMRLSSAIGCFGVVTNPLDDAVRAFYRRFGFEDLPFDPRRAMIVRIADLARSGF